MALLYVFVFTSCENHGPFTTAKIINENPLTFKLEGDCNLVNFSVLETSREKLLDKNHGLSQDKVLWQIKRDGNLIFASVWPEVTYGVVPKFYIQEIPEKGTPPPLSEGKYYIAWPYNTSTWGETVIFTIENGKIKVMPHSELRKLKAENNP